MERHNGSSEERWSKKERREKRRTQKDGRQKDRTQGRKEGREKGHQETPLAVAEDEKAGSRRLFCFHSPRRASPRIACARKLDNSIDQRGILDAAFLCCTRELALLLEITVRIHLDYVDLFGRCDTKVYARVVS